MARNGSARCFSGQKRMYPRTIAAESAVGCIWLANTRYLPFLAKSDRVLPVIATLLSFHPFLAIFCSVFGHFMFLSGRLLDYSNRSTWATRTINSKISPRWRGGWHFFSFFCKQFWKWPVRLYPCCLFGGYSNNRSFIKKNQNAPRTTCCWASPSQGEKISSFIIPARTTTRTFTVKQGDA